MQRSETKQYGGLFCLNIDSKIEESASTFNKTPVLHQFTQEQIVPTTVEQAWQFFSSPRNLPLITPPDLGFEVLSELPETMFPGLFIRYRVRPLFGIPIEWVTEITHVEDGRFFVDEQRIGPYKIWHHEHHFESVDAGVRMIDRVSYCLPFSPLGDLVHPWLVKPRLEHIFAYRTEQVEKRFGISEQ